MNQKIKELAKQIDHWDVSENGGNPIVYDKEPYGCACHIWFSSIEEFARLIVEDIIKLNYETESLSTSQKVSFENKVRKHFGIKDE